MHKARRQASCRHPAFGGTDFFAKRTQYIRLFNRAVDPALQAGAARAAERYPAAKDNPFIYLTPKAPAAQDNTIPSFIAVQTSSVSHVLDIGTEAVPGSIVMYRNGIKDTAFSYDAKTGLVHPLNPPLAFETVRITWQQHKEGGYSKTAYGKSVVRRILIAVVAACAQ